MLSIIFMNYSLAYSSIGFYQISKLFCIPVTLFIETLFGMRQQTLSVGLVFSLLLIIVGMCLVAEQEILLNTTGFIWAMLGVVATSTAQIFFGPLKKDLGLDSIQLLFHTSPWLAFGSFMSIPLFENTRSLADYSNGAVLPSIALSCIVAVAFNATNYVLLGLISPTSYNVLSHVKTVVIIGVGSYIFEAAPSRRVLAGMSLAMLGVLCYSAEGQRQQQLVQDGNSRRLGTGIGSGSGAGSSGAEKVTATAAKPDADRKRSSIEATAGSSRFSEEQEAQRLLCVEEGGQRSTADESAGANESRDNGSHGSQLDARR